MCAKSRGMPICLTASLQREALASCHHAALLTRLSSFFHLHSRTDFNLRLGCLLFFCYFNTSKWIKSELIAEYRHFGRCFLLPQFYLEENTTLCAPHNWADFFPWKGRTFCLFKRPLIFSVWSKLDALLIDFLVKIIESYCRKERTMGTHSGFSATYSAPWKWR